MKLLRLSLLAPMMLMTGCATILNGTHESVLVTTPPVSNAKCKLQNNNGVWYVDRTPGSVTVQRSYKHLDVSCSKAGYKTSSVHVKSVPNPMILGNAVFGGVVGAGVDLADGAATHYTSKIVVPMHK